jgi:hypothetical protein
MMVRQAVDAPSNRWPRTRLESKKVPQTRPRRSRRWAGFRVVAEKMGGEMEANGLTNIAFNLFPGAVPKMKDL